MDTTRRPGISLIETFVILGIVVALNIVGYHAFKRFDLTETQRYTVSPATRKILRQLADPVQVEFFMSTNLPSQMIRHRDDVRDMLQEYDIYGGANFRVRYIDPGDDLDLQERAEGLGVRKFQLQVIEREAATVRDVYFGLAMSYRDKTETIPQVLQPEMLEYELTSRLTRLTMRQKPKVAWFVGSININQQQGPAYGGVEQILGGAEGFYEMIQLDPATDQTLPDGLSAVLLFGAFGLSDSLKYSIDQYLMNGGSVFVAFDPMMQTGQQAGMGGLADAFPSLPTIEDQLEAYGIRVNKKLVVDMGSPAQATFTIGGFMRVQQPYPMWPMIGPEGITDSVGPLATLSRVVLPWCAPLSDLEREGTSFTPLFMTSSESFLMSSPFNLEPRQNWEFIATTSEERGPFRLGYMVSGAIHTAYPNGPPTPEAGMGEDGAPIPAVSPFDAGSHRERSDEAARLVVISSANAFSDNYLGQFPENQLLLANLGDMLALSEDLSAIRAQAIVARPLRPLTDAQKSFIRWASVVTLPLLVVLLGAIVWAVRQRRRQAIMRRYSSGAGQQPGAGAAGAAGPT